MSDDVVILTCTEVRDQLDLLAADACDPQTRVVLERHLHSCPACAEQLTESRRLMGLLDLQLNDSGLERLRQRVDVQARPARKTRWFAPTLRRALAAAALILIALGLGVWMPTADSEPRFSLVVDQQQAKVRIEPGMQEAKALLATRGKDLRARLLKAKDEGKLPMPPAIDLELALVNDSRRPIEVRLGDAVTRLTLDIDGDGVIRIPVTMVPLPEFLKPRLLRLQPGERHVVRVDRLIAGSTNELEFIYVVESGEYLIDATLRVTADRKAISVKAPPTRVRIGE